MYNLSLGQTLYVNFEINLLIDFYSGESVYVRFYVFLLSGLLQFDFKFLPQDTIKSTLS